MFGAVEGAKAVGDFLVVGSDHASLGKHFVKEVFCLVVIEEHGVKKSWWVASPRGGDYRESKYRAKVKISDLKLVLPL